MTAYGEQDHWGNDVSALRSNLKCSPVDRLRRAERGAKGILNLLHAAGRCKTSEPAEFCVTLSALASAQCDFLVIGFLATSIHGGDHVPNKLQLVLEPSAVNESRFWIALEPFGPEPLGEHNKSPFLIESLRPLGDHADIWVTSLCRIALYKGLGKEPYTELKERAIKLNLENLTIQVVSLDDLVDAQSASDDLKELGLAAELDTIKRLIAEEGLGKNGPDPL